jgi:hypothetical protein
VFTIPLADYKVTESEDVTLTCEINKPDRKATWLKDGNKLPVDARYLKQSLKQSLSYPLNY